MINSGTERLKKLFGKNVLKNRKRLALSQEELAERCGVSVETISHTERGVHGPRFDLLAKLSSALSVEVSELFDFS